MDQLRGDVRLADEALRRLAVLLQLNVKLLEDADVGGAVFQRHPDLGHAAFTERLDQAVTADSFQEAPAPPSLPCGGGGRVTYTAGFQPPPSSAFALP